MINNFNQIHPTVYTHKKNLVFSHPVDANELKEKIKIFLTELTKALKRSGCRLIGHIKGLLNAEDKGHLIFSITSFNEATHFKGEMIDCVEGAILTINIIVYGIEQKIIETKYHKIFSKHFG